MSRQLGGRWGSSPEIALRGVVTVDRFISAEACVVGRTGREMRERTGRVYRRSNAVDRVLKRAALG